MGKSKIQHGARRDLLWTNPNPSTLAASTIPISMDGYDCIEFECTEIGSPPSRTFFAKSPIGTATTPVMARMSSVYIERALTGLNAINIMTRVANVYLDAIEFYSGDMLYDGTYYKDWDNRAVPYRVWGIKY